MPVFKIWVASESFFFLLFFVPSLIPHSLLFSHSPYSCVFSFPFSLTHSPPFFNFLVIPHSHLSFPVLLSIFFILNFLLTPHSHLLSFPVFLSIFFLFPSHLPNLFSYLIPHFPSGCFTSLILTSRNAHRSAAVVSCSRNAIVCYDSNVLFYLFLFYSILFYYKYSILFYTIYACYDSNVLFYLFMPVMIQMSSSIYFILFYSKYSILFYLCLL